MHLPVNAEQRAVGVNDGGGVVINSGGAFLEQRRDDDDFVFLREFAKGVGRRAGNFFREFKILMVFALAKVLRAEQFLRANDVCAVFRGAFDERNCFLQIRVRVGGAGSLDQTQFDNLGGAFHYGSDLLMRAVCSMRSVPRALNAAAADGAFWPKSSRMNLPSVSLVGP